MNYTKALTIILFLSIQNPLFSQWEEKNISTNSTLSSVDFIDENIGYVVGGNDIFKTSNGGDDWDIIFSASELIVLEDIFIIDVEKIITVGKDFDTNQSKIFRTEDGGNSWESISISNISFLTSVYFPSSNIGYCTGRGGLIMKSTDSGNTWQELNSGTSNNLESVFFVNDLVGVAVGGFPINATILKTEDGGDNWNIINAPTNNSLQSVFFISQELGYSVGWNGEIIKTEDCGNSWTNQNSVAMTGNLEVLFTDNNTGYIVGGQADESLIQKTSNGGELWEDISPEIEEGLISVFFPTDDVGYAVGSNGTVVKTTSAGVVTSTEELNDLIDINIYPNPVSNILWIQSKNQLQIRAVKLYDINGRFINEVSCDLDKVDVDISSLESNIYYLEIQTDNGKEIKRIVKK